MAQLENGGENQATAPLQLHLEHLERFVEALLSPAASPAEEPCVGRDAPPAGQVVFRDHYLLPGVSRRMRSPGVVYRHASHFGSPSVNNGSHFATRSGEVARPTAGSYQREIGEEMGRAGGGPTDGVGPAGCADPRSAWLSVRTVDCPTAIDLLDHVSEATAPDPVFIASQ